MMTSRATQELNPTFTLIGNQMVHGGRCVLPRLSKQPLKNIVSMLIKEKDITSYQLLLINQDRVLVN